MIIIDNNKELNRKLKINKTSQMYTLTLLGNV